MDVHRFGCALVREEGLVSLCIVFAIISSLDLLLYLFWYKPVENTKVVADGLLAGGGLILLRPVLFGRVFLFTTSCMSQYSHIIFLTDSFSYLSSKSLHRTSLHPFLFVWIE